MTKTGVLPVILSYNRAVFDGWFLPMRDFPHFSRCALALLGISLFACAPILAASRPGAPRLLVVDTGATAPAEDQSITQPCAGNWQGKAALLFVRQSEGARNLWLATSNAPAANAKENVKEFEWVGRNTRWTARPAHAIARAVFGAKSCFHPRWPHSVHHQCTRAQSRAERAQ